MLAAIFWLVAFSLYFFTRPMPNLQTSRAEVWRQIPLVVLDWILPERSASSGPGLPSGWEFLPERLLLWGLAGVILSGAWGLGQSLLHWLIPRPDVTRLERFTFALGTGLSLVSLLTLALGLLGILHRSIFIGLLTGGFLLGLAISLWPRKQPTAVAKQIPPASQPVLAKWLCLLVLLPFLVAMLFGGVSPSTDFDVKEYHFEGPKEWFLLGRVQFLEHNVYTSFPFLTEMLTLLGMVLRNDWFLGALVGKSVLIMFIPLTGLAILAAGRRWFGEWPGWLGMLVWLTTPWATRIAIIAYAEGGLACYLFLAFFATGIAIEHYQANERKPRLFFLAGFLAGSAMACKYTGLVSAVFPMAAWVGWTVVRHRLPNPSDSKLAWRTLGTFSLGVAIAVGPWLLKNLIETGNPVYPLAWSIFGGTDWNADLNAQWKAAHSPPHHRVSSLFILENGAPGWVIDVMAINDWLSPLLYGLAPLVFLVPTFRRWSFPIWLFAAWLFLAWWAFTHRLDRFWVPMLPVIALLAGAGAAWSFDRPWKIACGTIMGLSLLFNYVLIATQNAGYIAWLTELEEAGAYTARLTAPEIASLNELAQKGAKEFRVLSVGEAEVFDARFPVVYNTVFDRSIFQEWTEDPDFDLPPAERPMRSAAEIGKKFHEEDITHVFVNWQEILRYRTTYGYADYVHPARFDWLVENGLLEEPVILTRRPWTNLSASEKRELIESDWREALGEPSASEESIILSALYRVK